VHLFAHAACDYIIRQSKTAQPFFLYLPFNAPHFPSARNKQNGAPNIWQAPERSFKRYGWSAEEADPKRRYYAVVTALDEAIGRVLDQIDDQGISSNTLVAFYSDNGAFMLPGRGLEVSSNAPLRDGGVTLWEGGIRVPCLVRWPGKIKPGTVCNEPWVSLDLCRLCLELAGLSQPTDRTLDGANPLPMLTESAPSAHEFLAFAYRKYQAIRMGDYKLIKPPKQSDWQLYHLKTDIAEENDLAAENPERVRAMNQRFNQWLESTQHD